jgi:hypothetical protein
MQAFFLAADGRRMGEGWEKDGRRMGGGWEEDGRRMGGGWEEDGRRMGGARHPFPEERLPGCPFLALEGAAKANRERGRYHPCRNRRRALAVPWNASKRIADKRLLIWAGQAVARTPRTPRKVPGAAETPSSHSFFLFYLLSFKLWSEDRRRCFGGTWHLP